MVATQKDPREEVIQAWYMDDSDEDQRLPHHKESMEFVSLDQLAGRSILKLLCIRKLVTMQLMLRHKIWLLLLNVGFTNNEVRLWLCMVKIHMVVLSGMQLVTLRCRMMLVKLCCGGKPGLCVKLQ